MLEWMQGYILRAMVLEFIWQAIQGGVTNFFRLT